MSIKEQIATYIAIQPQPKRSDMQELHGIILKVMPKCKLWFLDGEDDKGKTVFNPNIRYGSLP
jgi:hypothetical protein